MLGNGPVLRKASVWPDTVTCWSCINPDELLLALNRWFKLAPTPQRLTKAFGPFLHHAIQSADKSALQLEGLPSFLQEALVFEAAQEVFGAPNEQDAVVHYAILHGQAQVEQVAVRLKADWATLQGRPDWLSLHSSQTKWPLSPSWFEAWSAHWALETPTGSLIDDSLIAWQQTLWLNSPILPWGKVFDVLEDHSLERFPYLYSVKCRLASLGLLEANHVDLSSIDDRQTLLTQAHQALEHLPNTSLKPLPRVWPLRRLVLVEGPTEELLLPAMAKANGRDLAAEGCLVKSMGGKPQLHRVYNDLSDWLAVPIQVVVDSDARGLAESLVVRSEDFLYWHPEGELEDLLQPCCWLAVLNQALAPYPVLTHERALAIWHDEGLNETAPMVKRLSALWRVLGNAPFDKIAFARHVVQLLDSKPILAKPYQPLIDRLCGAC